MLTQQGCLKACEPFAVFSLFFFFYPQSIRFFAKVLKVDKGNQTKKRFTKKKVSSIAYKLEGKLHRPAVKSHNKAAKKILKKVLLLFGD